jgi:hypothetical protein
MHRRLPAPERYPLPPREIIEGVLPEVARGGAEERGRQTTTLAAHFGYGAATGALYALVPSQTVPTVDPYALVEVGAICVQRFWGLGGP